MGYPKNVQNAFLLPLSDYLKSRHKAFPAILPTSRR
jgi:hypothetical protein